jgi:16S rRNA (guanine(966)-N(2))-methyltransferase RsmD
VKRTPGARGGAGGNRVRIVGGTHRSRLIDFPAVEGLRPTPDRVRETVFNWLGQDLTGRDCLDVFAGSGALGFEAASRGARSVLMIERDGTCRRALGDNASTLGLDAVSVAAGDALEFLRLDQRRFHVVFLDPPFADTDYPALMALAAARVDDGGFLYVEAPRPLPVPAGWTIHRHLAAGRVHAHLLRRQTP